ncbi:MAG TPA: YfhO family protein, partial [Planctomycetota bacterium]|nr:YfhO family protein [Planctomycetota bacterium]
RTPLQAVMAGIVVLAVASLLPDFRSSVLPSHDARQTHSALHVLTAGLCSEGEIPQWLPYGRYGNGSFLLLLNVTPLAYAASLAASLLVPTSTMILFKIVVLLEFLLFVAGSLRLSALLFRDPAATALVNLGAVLSFSWLSSLDANFHTFYLLPFILDSLVRFSRDGRFRWLLLASLFCVASAIGNVPYYPPMMAMLLTVFCAALMWSRNAPLPRIRFALGDVPLAVFVVILAAAHVGGYWTSLRGQHFYTVGRDPVTGKALFHFFLEYNGVSTLPNLAKVFLTGAHTHGDLTFYVGLAPLALAFLALSRCRRSEFIAIASMAVFLGLFSFGGVVARASYFFPGMAYYRHIGLVFGQAKYLVLLMAGFGLEALLQGPPQAPEVPPSVARRLANRILFALAGLLALGDLGWSVVRPERPWSYLLLPGNLDITTGDLILPLVRIAAYGLAFALAAWNARTLPFLGKSRLYTAALLASFLVDIGSFKVLQIVQWPRASSQEESLARHLYQPRPIAYRPLRTSSDEEEDRSAEFQFAAERGKNACVYSHVYSLVGVDPRMPTFRVDSLSDGVSQLFRSRGVAFDQFPKDSLLPEGDHWLLDALGARKPKLRICAASEVEIVPSDRAPDAVASLPRDSDRVIVSGSMPAGSAAKVEGAIAVTSFGFNHVTLEVSVQGTSPSWLYYADADHEGWTARVDGRQTPIARANLAFKAVPLLPGVHHVEFRYWNGWGSLCLYVLAAGSVLGLSIGGFWLARGVITDLRGQEAAGR